MKKWTRRLSASGLALLGIVIILGLIGWRLLRGIPDWYQPEGMTVEQREAAAERATNKIVTLQNEAARARADEAARARQAGANQTALRPAIRPDNAISISFTDDEINALVAKWSVWQSVKAGYERFMSDPYIVLKDGRLILAGKIKGLDAVASFHFDPQIQSDGRLKVGLVRILAGKLPVPEAFIAQYQKRATDGLAVRMPAWRQQAAIDPSGIANTSAISASMGQMLMDVLGQQSSEPVLFLTVLERGSIPVKVTEVKIENHTLNMVVCPMTPEERAELLRRIRDGSAVASGKE